MREYVGVHMHGLIKAEFESNMLCMLYIYALPV